MAFESPLDEMTVAVLDGLARKAGSWAMGAVAMVEKGVEGTLAAGDKMVDFAKDPVSFGKGSENYVPEKGETVEAQKGLKQELKVSAPDAGVSGDSQPLTQGRVANDAHKMQDFSIDDLGVNAQHGLATAVAGPALDRGRDGPG